MEVQRVSFVGSTRIDEDCHPHTPCNLQNLHSREKFLARIFFSHSSVSLSGLRHTEVQLLSFGCSTGGKGSQPRLWNIV